MIWRPLFYCVSQRELFPLQIQADTCRDQTESPLIKIASILPRDWLSSSAKGLGWSTCQSCQITLWRCPSIANVRSARHESCLQVGSGSLQDRILKKVRHWASDSNLPKSQVCISIRYRNIRRLFLQTLWKETGPLFPKHHQWLLMLKSGRKKYQVNLNHISFRFSENWKASCQDFFFGDAVWDES